MLLFDIYNDTKDGIFKKAADESDEILVPSISNISKCPISEELEQFSKLVGNVSVAMCVRYNALKLTVGHKRFSGVLKKLPPRERSLNCDKSENASCSTIILLIPFMINDCSESNPFKY